MLLGMARENLSSEAMTAVLSIDKTVNAFPLDKRLPIAAEILLDVLRERRLIGQEEPERQQDSDTLGGNVQTWLRRKIESLRFGSPIDLPDWR